MKYTYRELREKIQGIEQFLNNEDLTLKFELVYKLKKFKKSLLEEAKLIEEELPDDNPEIKEYQEKIVQAYVDAGATPKRQNGQVSVQFDDPNLDKEKAEKTVSELKEEYADAIKKQTEIYEKQEEILRTPLAEVELPSLSFDMFPEEVKANAIPDFIIDMIVEDES